MKVIKTIYFILGLLAFYLASATGFYKYGIPTGFIFIFGAYAIVIIERRSIINIERRRNEENKN
ncbi:hypothetical protein [Sinorhizobium fredii]|uniref:hypothetical protein n=1 Tax=Rhizobium fredii TaxID=380 RepID=UPI0011D2536D|nr:hypothetical protein [Sinorhizobium fredii]WOS65315.1 hypothetical protein SFGR64A_27765 [Sinorhizobium fredii GR64]